MTPLPITASTLTNACGVGWEEVRRSLRAGRTGLRRNDFEPATTLDTYIGRVDALETHGLPDEFEAYECRNNRLAHLCVEQDDFVRAVQNARRRHGAQRIGVYVGTSTSGILSSELAFRGRVGEERNGVPALSPQLYRHCHGMFATTEFVRTYLRLAGPAITISTACSSSAKVFASAARGIAAGICDAAVVGGVDSLALSTLFGFHALELLSRNPCRPFCIDRDGISIGEAAGFALLERDGEAAIALLGVGESSDAYHMSSPHPDGEGAAKAMRAALADARLQPDDIDYINLHGTASRANDIAEDRAVTSVFGAETPASSTKGYTGHALGAAGITEVLITLMALERQWLPGTLNCGTVDPVFGCDLMLESRAQSSHRALSNSFGFGGNNCSVVLGSRS
jgi:3-oxoacyl-[acyl-carrier-protein] synthase-1